MAAANITGCVRFGRYVVDNTLNFKCYAKRWMLNPGTVSYKNSSRHLSATSENVQNSSEVEGENSDGLKKNIEELNKEIETLNQKVVTLDDKYKRSLADGENLRLRLTKQIEDAKIFGIQKFCKDLLDVSDILQRATESVPKDEVSDKNPHLKGLYEGLLMTEAQLQSVFRRHGLVPVNPLNEKFNPNLHEALFQQEVEGQEPGTVVVVSKIGYKLQERVIRPALVGVAKGP